jgi:serine O-acetyltransferase
MIEIKSINVEFKNFFQLSVEIAAEGNSLSYSYYLYKNKEIIDKSSYSSQATKQYNLTEPGNYFVRIYIKDKQGNRLAENTERISFNGFHTPGIKEEPDRIIIYGVSRLSAAIKLILQEQNKVDFFVSLDTLKVGQDFFGTPIVRLGDIPELSKYKILVVDEFDQNAKSTFEALGQDYEVFTKSTFPNNVVIKLLYLYSAIKIYRISRLCYLNGLIEGATFLKDFIRFKFNSVIPYTALIDEGTRLGYGGIGVVIHSKAIIGKDCVIGQNVTIGSRGPLPVIGDNVFVGPGSKCIGGRIGSNVVIGANSVVTKDVNDNCVVAGVPAKVISTQIENYFSYMK